MDEHFFTHINCKYPSSAYYLYLNQYIRFLVHVGGDTSTAGDLDRYLLQNSFYNLDRYQLQLILHEW